MSGYIVARDQSVSFATGSTIHVKSPPSEECGAIYLVRQGTPIMRRSADGRLSRASLSDLTVGREVTVWAEYLLKSCPGQSEATAVELRD